MTLTVNDRERLAYINADAPLLALIDEIELERDEVPVDSAAIGGHEQGRETNAWCLARVADALNAAKPLRKSQMRLFASALQGLAERPPKKGYEELAFRARIDRICGLLD